ncbi:MAG: hypothetical protein H0T04_01395 [Chloroflexi bacterium]|nr:hypothetical protein [Chloroflexota bacterium]MBA3851341.1 hypothetical protein [Chloroflexota bacterium]MDQ3407331.1 hypothetical protein [Chloroflexota bacterium]
MDHDEILESGPRLDRQEVKVARDAKGRPLVPSRVPETRPTPLQDAFIYLSIGVLVSGVIAITALELGARLSDPVIRLPVLVGGALLALVTLDAMVRIWRSAWAWLPVDRGRGLFRFVWVAVLGASLAVLAAIVWLVFSA